MPTRHSSGSDGSDFDWEERLEARRAQRRKRRRASGGRDVAALLSAKSWRKRRTEFELEDRWDVDDDDWTDSAQAPGDAAIRRLRRR